MTTNSKKIAGNPHTSSAGVLMYASLWFLMLTILFTLDLKTALMFSIFEILFLYFGALHLDYFIITDRNLIAKNHLLSWVNVTYNLKDINTVTFELFHRRRLSRSILIKTFQFNERRFYIAGLEEEQRNELKKIFTDLSIPVTDEKDSFG